MPVPFPTDSWTFAFDGYTLAEVGKDHASNSISARRSSVLGLARRYPDIAPEALTRRQLHAHLAGLRRTHSPGSVVSHFANLRAFYAWLAADGSCSVYLLPALILAVWDRWAALPRAA